MPLNIVTLCADALPSRSDSKLIPSAGYQLQLSDKDWPALCFYHAPIHCDSSGTQINAIEKIEAKYTHPRINKKIYFQEIYRHGLSKSPLATAQAEIVIYVINVRRNETPEAFAKRAQEEIKFLQRYDLSDFHATRHVIIDGRANTDTNFDYTHLKICKYIAKNDILLKSIFSDLIRSHNEPNLISRILGCLLFVFFSNITAFIFANPLALFFNNWPENQWDSVGNSIFSLVQSSLYIVLFPLLWLYIHISAIAIPSVGIGWNRGIITGLASPYVTVKHLFRENFYFVLQNSINSLIIIGLTTAAILLTLGVFGPAIIGGVGLAALAVKGATIAAGFIGASSSSVSLAFIAGTVTAVGSFALCWMGYGAYFGIKAAFNFFRKLCYRSAENEIDAASAARKHAQGPIEFYIPSNPVKASLPVSVLPAPTVPVAPQLPIVSSPTTAAAVDPFGPAAYQSVLQPAPRLLASTTKYSGDPREAALSMSRRQAHEQRVFDNFLHGLNSLPSASDPHRPTQEQQVINGFLHGLKTLDGENAPLPHNVPPDPFPRGSLR